MDHHGLPDPRDLADPGHSAGGLDVPLSFEASEMKGRVAFDKQGQVAGLFVLPTEIP